MLAVGDNVAPQNLALGDARSRPYPHEVVVDLRAEPLAPTGSGTSSGTAACCLTWSAFYCSEWSRGIGQASKTGGVLPYMHEMPGARDQG